MWAWCEEAFPEAIQVLDLWHALQHLKDALDCAYGDGTAEAMHRFEKLRETLKEDPTASTRSFVRCATWPGSTPADTSSPASSLSSQANGIA